MLDGTQDEGWLSDLPLWSSRAFILVFVFLVTDDSDDDGMEMDNEDYKVVSKGKLKSYEVEYESLSQSAVERLMQRDVDHICGILGVDVRTPLCITYFVPYN